MATIYDTQTGRLIESAHTPNYLDRARYLVNPTHEQIAANQPPAIAPTWDDYRALRAAGFDHWNKHVPSMMILGYPPAIANKAAIADAYNELLTLPDSGATADAAIARMRELDAWLAESLARPPAFPPA